MTIVQRSMITFQSIEIEFELSDESAYFAWLSRCAKAEGCFIGQLNYIFCSDEYLLSKNQQFLEHDTYTDIITFDYCDGDVLNGDILISIDRVRENAEELEVSFELELKRVMAHGLLHLAGYGDKSNEEAALMREKESHCLQSFPSIPNNAGRRMN